MSIVGINKYRWLVAIQCLLIFSCLNAQISHSRYNIINYKTPDGLPQNSVKNIEFDLSGYCWLGTEMGLVRFDGKNFKVFDMHNVDGLLSERIRYITKDKNGEIYAQTDRAQIMKIEVQTNSMASYPKIVNRKYSNIWLPLKGGNAIESPFLRHWSDSLYNITQFLWVSNTGMNTKYDETYLIQKDEILYVKNNKMSVIDTFNTLVDDIKQLLVDDIFVQIYPGGSLKAWKNGLRVKNITGIYGPLIKNSLFRSGHYKCMFEDEGMYIYAGDVLYKIKYHDGILNSEIVLEGIEIPAISTVNYNKESETYYLGSFVSGLYVASPKYFSYGKIPLENMENSFYSQALTKDGSVFSQSYLFHENGEYSNTSLTRFLGSALYISPGQKLYYGGEPQLKRFDIGSNKDSTLAVMDSRLSSIYQDKTDPNTIVFSTSASFYKMKNDVVTEVKKIPNKNGSLSLMCTEQTGRDSFLLATQSGLKWYDFKNNKVYRSILKNKYIRSTYAEGVDRVWCSTYGQGYYLYDKGKITSLPTDRFPALKTTHSFIDDGRGYFWLPTNNGLYKVKKSDLLDYSKDTTLETYIYSFNTSDNLKTNEFNGGCSPGYLWLHDSILSLPSLEGLVRFSPFKINIVLPNKKIYISDISVDGKVVDFPYNSRLDLKPGFTKLSISVSSPYFGNKENLRLHYKIEGLYNDWQTVPSNGEINLNRIPSGTYKLIIKKLNGFGSAEIDSLELSIHVAPWFYFTWWFMTIVSVILSYLIYFLIKHRIKVLKENNLKLERLIAAQTRDLSNTVDQLALSESELRESNQMKDRVITIVLHDLRSPIRFLHLMSNQLSKGYLKYTTEVMSQRLNSLKSATASLNQFTEQFFAWAASQHSDFKSNSSRVNLNEIFNDVKDLYSDIVNVNGNILTFQITNLIIYTDRNILSVILRNLVDNANNNTRNGTISLAGWQEGDDVIISIKDNGKGFDEEELNAFNDKNVGTIQGGHGSLIVSSLIEKIRGKLMIETQKGKGTIFKVRLNTHHASHND